jgi:acetyl-CoA carboxylase biotin carboxyl carrier protein
VELTFSELRELVATLNQTDISELTLKSADFELTLRKPGALPMAAAPLPTAPVAAPPAAAPSQPAPEPAAAPPP